MAVLLQLLLELLCLAMANLYGINGVVGLLQLHRPVADILA